jgi:hypothetical protein
MMDINMEDVGRVPEPSKLSPATEPASIPTLDGWIESLMNCKQLAEVDVQRLCEKVCVRSCLPGLRELRRPVYKKFRFDVGLSRHGKYCKRSPMFNLW